MKKNIHKWLIVITIIACLILVFAVILPAVYAPRANVMQFSEIYDYEIEWGPRAMSPKELEQVSDLVVLFKPEEYVTRSGYQGIEYAVTRGSIQQVIRGDGPQTERIDVIEYGWFNEIKLKTVDCYFPMHMGQTYLLFLRLVDDPASVNFGRYHIVDYYRGKYVLDARTDFLARLYLDAGTEFELATGSDYQKMLAEWYIKQWYMPMRELYPDVFE